MKVRKQRVLGVILAGGASRRFGADKTAALLGGSPLLAWIVERARSQAQTLLLNVNNSDTGRDFGLERLTDGAPGQGPIAGILAALDEADRRGFEAVASFACDTPFFPRDTVARLAAAFDCSGDYAMARCGGIVHRIFALWPLTCRTGLAKVFAGGARSMRDIEDRLLPAFADFPAGGGPGGDPFFNINTAADLAAAERWLAARSNLH